MQRRHTRIPCTRTEGAWAQAEVTDQARNSQSRARLGPRPSHSGYATEATRAPLTARR